MKNLIAFLTGKYQKEVTRDDRLYSLIAERGEVLHGFQLAREKLVGSNIEIANEVDAIEAEINDLEEIADILTEIAVKNEETIGKLEDFMN